MVCNTYEECCNTIDTCKETFRDRTRNLQSLINSMDLVERASMCPRNNKDYVCNRINMGTLALDKTVESSLWLVRKTNEILLHFPFLQREGERGLREESEESFYNTLLPISAFKNWNELCECGLDELCPKISPNCSVDEIVSLMNSESTQNLDQNEMYRYVQTRYLDDYLSTL